MLEMGQPQKVNIADLGEAFTPGKLNPLASDMLEMGQLFSGKFPQIIPKFRHYIDPVGTLLHPND